MFIASTATPSSVDQISLASCSTQPGFGKNCRNSFCAIEQISPCSLNKIQRLLVVPASSAITYFAIPCSSLFAPYCLFMLPSIVKSVPAPCSPCAAHKKRRHRYKTCKHPSCVQELKSSPLSDPTISNYILQELCVSTASCIGILYHTAMKTQAFFDTFTIDLQNLAECQHHKQGAADPGVISFAPVRRIFSDSASAKHRQCTEYQIQTHRTGDRDI